MTLQTSGAISLQQIALEFGGATTNLVLEDYYAGGTHVAAGTLNGSSVAIPSSGAIKLQDFYGASNIVFNTSTASVNSQGAAGGSSSGTVSLNPDGSISHSGSGTVVAGHYVGPANWATPTSTGLGSNYQLIIDTITIGIAPTSHSPTATGSWGSMGGTLAFVATNTSANHDGDVTWSCRIRNSTTLAVVASFDVAVSLTNT